MTTETTPIQTAAVTSPIVSNGDPQPVVSSPVVEAAAPEAPAPAPVVETPPAAPATTQPDWAINRINELTAKRYEAERKAEAAEAAQIAAETKAAELLNQIANKTATPAPTTAALPEEEIEKRALEKAQQIARANEFNKACNTIVEVGKKEFKDWDDAVKNLSLVGAIGQNTSPEFLQSAIELKNPAKVLHYLGTNMEEADRIVKLSPTRMAMELARVEAQLNAPAALPPIPVSNAPAPVIPVGGVAKPGPKSLDDPNLTTEEFMQLRAQSAAERQSRYKRA